MSDKELDEMVLEADSDKDGLINYQGNNRYNLIFKIFYSKSSSRVSHSYLSYDSRLCKINILYGGL